MQIRGEERHRCGSDRDEARAHFTVQQPLGDDRADADPDSEERQHHRHHLLVREKHVFGKRRQSRDHGRAKQPEPGHREDRKQQRRTRRHVADDGDRVAQQARARRIGSRGWRRRDLTCRNPAEERTDNAAAADDESPLGEQDHASTKDRAEEDCEECARLDERVARDEFVLVQVLRKQRVLDRAEDCRVGAEEEECCEEERHAFEPEAHGANSHDDDFGDLDDASDIRLVDAISQRARCAREEEERRNEDRPGQHDEGGGVHARLLGQPERHHDSHRALQQVVVEGAEELRDEQRCKAASGQELDEGRSHDTSPLDRFHCGPGRGDEPVAHRTHG